MIYWISLRVKIGIYFERLTQKTVDNITFQRFSIFKKQFLTAHNLKKNQFQAHNLDTLLPSS